MAKISIRTFDNVKKRCDKLESHYSGRNDQCVKCENIFLMKWEDEKPEAKPHIKFTISPNGRLRAKGAIDILSAADPKFSVPYDKNNSQAKEMANKIEKAAEALWYVGGRVRQSPIHHDMITSAVLFGEIHASTNSTKDILASIKSKITLDKDKQAATASAMKRAERIAAQTPHIFEVYDPKTCYPDMDNYGLSFFYRKISTTAGVIIDRWGGSALAQGLNNNDRFARVDYCEAWDNNIHVVWIFGNSEMLWGDEHNLIEMPLVSQTIGGSTIFNKPEDAVQPFLFSYVKGKIAERENLLLTAMMSNTFAFAANPQFIEKLQSPERVTQDDFSVPGGKKKLLVNESYEPMVKNAIDPSVVNMWELEKQLGQMATITDQAMGQPLGANAPFSLYAMVAQAGRLPLINIQQRTSWAIGRLMEITMRLQKQAGGSIKMKRNKRVIELSSADIPDDLTMEAALKVTLPQDQKANIQMSIAATSGENPQISMETSRQEFWDIDQSDDEQEKIWNERFAELEARKKYQMDLADMELEIAQKQMQVKQQIQAMQQQDQMDNQAQDSQVISQQTADEQAAQQKTVQQQRAMPPLEQMEGLPDLGAGGAQEGLPQTEPNEPRGMP